MGKPDASKRPLETNLYRLSVTADGYAFAASRGVTSRDVDEDSETREAESELDGRSSVLAEFLRVALFFLGGGNSGQVHCRTALRLSRLFLHMSKC